MNEANGNEVGEVRGGERCGRGGKLWVLVVAVLALGGIVGVFCFRGEGVREQLRAMADRSGGTYSEEARGSKWYADVAEEYNLPIVKRPVMFGSHEVTDADMAIVGKANTLRDVDLRGSEITDAGLAHLKRLTELEALQLDETLISDQGLVHLQALKNLAFLSLRKTQVTDEGLSLLSGLGNLSGIFLSDTQVTDAGLVHLKSLKGLTYLALSGTHVTAEGVADLKSAIPNLRIEFK